MALDTFLYIVDSDGQPIKGGMNGDTVPMEIAGYSLNLQKSFDEVTGSSSKEQIGPFLVTREVDGASPQLFGAAATNESLSLLLVGPETGWQQYSEDLSGGARECPDQPI